MQEVLYLTFTRNFYFWVLLPGIKRNIFSRPDIRIVIFAIEKLMKNSMKRNKMQNLVRQTVSARGDFKQPSVMKYFVFSLCLLSFLSLNTLFSVEEEDSAPYRIVDLQTNISCDASGYTFLEARKQDEEQPYMKLQPKCRRVQNKV